MFSKDHPHLRQVLTCMMASAFLAQQNLQAATASSIQSPSGGTYTAGAGTIKSFGNAVTINQSTLRGIIDWNSFSLSQGASITFKNGSGATLNLVNNGPISSILGSLIATGSVYLINPAGVLIGVSGRVNTGGDFLASTLKVSPETFMQGGALDFSGSSKAAVVNLGSLYSSTGSVFLIGHQITNGGSIAAANGSAGLAAGSEVLLKDSTGDQRIFVKGVGGDITNSGTIAAAQAELRAKGGNIYALAGNSSSIAATGTATINGKIWLVSDGGNTTVNGTVSAQNASGTGGDIETSGHNLSITGATVKTGQGGNWLLDPVDLTVDSAAASTIETSLALTNVTLQTTSSTASGPGNQNTSGVGDIIVNAPISWASNQTLTLDAYHGITINSPITSSGSSAVLTILTNDGGSGGYFTVNSPIVLNASAALNINGNPYTLITNATDLQNMSTGSSSYYALDTNLDLTTFGLFQPIANFNPIGFQGAFEGLGHTITGMNVDLSQRDGMFYANAGLIENLTLSGSSISTIFGYAGLLAGFNSGLVNNVSASGTVTMNDSIGTGGLVGGNSGTIFGSSSSASVNANGTGQNVGGLVGVNLATISNSFATGTVTVGPVTAFVGGLVGSQPTGSTSQSYATGAVNAGDDSWYVGGLIGSSHSAVSNSYATSAVTCGAACPFVGGLEAFNSGTVSGSYATGAVTGGNTTSYAGGLIGYTSGPVSQSYATGSVTVGTGSEQVGDLVGYQAASTISQSYATGAVSSGNGSLYVGGLIGESQGGVTGSFATGAVGCGASCAFIGGLEGWSNNGTVSTSYATGAVTSGATVGYIGGLVGFSTGSISQSYASGAVSTGSGATYVGGLAGENDSTISNSYATSSVTVAAGLDIGGLVGKDLGTINYSYSTGAVSPGAGSTLFGGLVGLESGTTTGSYWDITTSGQSTDGSAATGLTTLQWLTQGPTVTSATGWNFTNTWVAGYPYPVLKNLSYIVSTFSGTQTYGDHTGSTFASTASSILDQNGNNASSFINGVLTTVLPATNPSVGNYGIAGGTGQTAAAGYQLTYLGNVIINPLTLSIAGTTIAANKVYDGTTLATISGGTIPGVISGDSVTLTQTGVFGDKNAGIGKTVNYTNTLTGAAAGNYVLSVLSGSTNGTITPLTVTVGGTTVAGNKTYDSTTLATIAGATVAGILSGDSVTFSQAGTFADKNAGIGKTVNFSNTLTGADAGNYTLSVLSGSTTATINRATLTGTFTIGNKTYDGTTAATGTAGSLLGILTGDQVALGSGTYQFTDANAGAGKTGTASAVTLAGADAGNYTVQLTQFGTATISPAPLYYIASGGISRAFGLANPTFAGSISGLVGSDTLASTTTGSLLFTSPATFSSGIGSYAINGSGLTLTTGNYTLAQASSNSTAFTVQPLTVSVGSVSRASSTPNPTFTIDYSGVTSPYLQQLLASLQLVSNAPGSDLPGTYQINALVPGQLVSDIIVQPGILTITAGSAVSASGAAALSSASFPAALQSQPTPPPAPLTFFSGANASGDQSLPPNAVSQFQVVITPSQAWAPASSRNSQNPTQPLSVASFADVVPGGEAKKDRSTYNAGAKKP